MLSKTHISCVLLPGTQHRNTKHKGVLFGKNIASAVLCHRQETTAWSCQAAQVLPAGSYAAHDSHPLRITAGIKWGNIKEVEAILFDGQMHSCNCLILIWALQDKAAPAGMRASNVCRWFESGG